MAGEYVTLLGESYYCIRNYDQMPPFFMNIVSSSDQWMFISSTGGLTAGRKDAQSALFPYTTDDRITENYDNTGNIAILWVTSGEHTYLWEPFSPKYAGIYTVERNLYKNVCGNKLIFEEINHDLDLTYRYAWRSSDRYGFVKTTWVFNHGTEARAIAILDGLQNLLPYGVTTALQSTFSNLLNAYKRNELETKTGLGMFTLSSTLTDLAEPSESLMATTVWQRGLTPVAYLLSARQVADFERGLPVTQETDVRGYRGAYLVVSDLDLAPGAEKAWCLVAEVNQDSRKVAALINALQQRPVELQAEVEADIDRGTADLMQIVASADGLQTTGDHAGAAHHFANVLFNVMRGGIFVANSRVPKADFVDFVTIRYPTVLETYSTFFAALPNFIEVRNLIAQAAETGIATLARLCYEYLPLTFSRRHGDPSRPWNQISINVKKSDGASFANDAPFGNGAPFGNADQKLDYQGNWRDIFQNWEPLAYSYPEFVESMIARFVNATTMDGYNPYRVTRDGIEWEVPAPEDPWANIGYWSDHQIIYLQKLLEISSHYHPGQLAAMLEWRIFSHANVPYRIKPYAALLEDWYDTIDFDRKLHEVIQTRVRDMGADGKLVLDAAGQVLHVNLAEKLLILLLAKLANFVPGGGIWMNTQRPEWNDANNALVGKGLSVVTLCYLRRYVAFCRALFADAEIESITITRAVQELFMAIFDVLREYQSALETTFDDDQRRAMMDALGQAGSDYRWACYRGGSGETLSGNSELDQGELLAFLDLVQRYVEHTLRANERSDHMYHAYNVLVLGSGTASLRHLYEMLEGQVAILSSGLLSGAESLALLQSLRASALYRADQHSYILYPDRDLPGFLRKNTIPAEDVADLSLVAALVARGDSSLIIKDENEVYHFNGRFRNDRDVKAALAELAQQPKYAPLVEAESDTLLALFEKTFNHSAFTGRSGTFFAYEGLGSIYWHMVSKLLLATQETCFRAVARGEAREIVAALAECYYDIRQGLGFNKTPAVYGAFPTDPYSHTPAGQGAKQPGMTGLVKEEILTRMGELGMMIVDGQLTFTPLLLRDTEFLPEATTFAYIDVSGISRSLPLPSGALVYTFCQVPVVYVASCEEKMDIYGADGQVWQMAGLTLDAATSRHIFQRDGVIKQVTVHINL
ncbi:MAG: hypothetical protein JXA33_00640 [Anaerolineae bacterium]|nr:hypothetical protein [Anaerolineae bacterium]